MAELIPYILESFLENDRGFAKARRERGLDGSAAETDPARTCCAAPAAQHDRTIIHRKHGGQLDVRHRHVHANQGRRLGRNHPHPDHRREGQVRPERQSGQRARAGVQDICGAVGAGCAWRERTSGDNPRDYLSVRLDDPSLPEPISAAMFEGADGKEAQLVWNRRRSE